MHKLGVWAAGCAAAILSTTAAQAAVTTFSDRSAFNAAGSVQVTDDFEHTAAGESTDYAFGYTGNGFTAKGSGLYLLGVDPGFYPTFYDWGSGDVMLYRHSGVTTFTFDAQVNSIGIDLMTIVNFGGDVEVSVDGESYVVSTANNPMRTFFGLVSDKAFSSFTITSRGGMGLFDNLSFGAFSSAVPEPSTWAMMIVGFAGVGGMVRRSRRQTRAAFA